MRGGRSQAARWAGGLFALGLTGSLALAGPASAKPTVTRNAPKPKIAQLKITSSTAPPIVSLIKTTCTYDPRTHEATAGGAVTWVPPDGGGALGTITVVWTTPPKKVRHGQPKKHSSTTTTRPQSYTVSATSSQFFSGLWSLTASPAQVPKTCAVAANFVPPTAESVEAYVAAKGLPMVGLIAFTSATDPNHLLGRPTGYLSKVAWQDTRIDQTNQPSDPGGIEWGGGIEVFGTAEQAKSRAGYLISIETADPIVGSEYDYLLGPILLRVSGTFTPDTAAGYGNALPGATLYTPAPASSPATTTTAP
jgi:plastocyanin